jgi:hypothetical protein
MLTGLEILSRFGMSGQFQINQTEKRMNTPTPSAPADKSVLVESEVATETGKVVEQHIPRVRPHQLEIDAERIRSSIARLTSNSTNGLEGLMSELQELQNFLKTEVERVQGEIESALAGIKIIIETIAPWKTIPTASPTNPRAVRAGPAANIDVSQPRR